jgi:hypothetical protein
MDSEEEEILRKMKEKSIDQAGLNNKSDNLVPRTVV